MPLLLLAQDAAGQQAQPSIMGFAPFVLIALFVLVVMLPASRRQKR